MSYDPSVLNKYAYKLSSKASSIELMYCIYGIVIGFAVMAAVASYVSHANISLAWIAGFIAGWWVASTGFSKALALRAQANMAYALIQIESNTRPENQL